MPLSGQSVVSLEESCELLLSKKTKQKNKPSLETANGSANLFFLTLYLLKPFSELTNKQIGIVSLARHMAALNNSLD